MLSVADQGASCLWQWAMERCCNLETLPKGVTKSREQALVSLTQAEDELSEFMTVDPEKSKT